ncbi:MAG TPA: enoyl-CoA hydratase/isomerase family protein [Acidimicrobiia bacterium]|nr:enoyl-CoA hydratase/isomerase family protein [Acidimicrobiia bacterium]
MADLVEFSLEGAVALIRLNRPPVNALSEELSQDLTAAFERAADPAIRAVVVTGQPHFAAGADIKGFQDAYDLESEERLASTLSNGIVALESLAKPVIAAIHGYALGGGLELALGADFRYLAEDAQVGQPEIKLGLIPGAGGTQRLQRLVGHQKARDIVYSGRFVGAEEALAIGLAEKVAVSADLVDVALTDAARWAEGPTPALAAAKRALNRGWGLPIEDALVIEADEFNKAFWTDDAREGVAAFIEKRQPRFTGS